MTHELECLNAAGDCCPDVGALSVTGECGCQCTCAELKAAYQRGYTAGYNAHAAAAQHWRDTHGAYRQLPAWTEFRDAVRAAEGFNQHGPGENP